MLVQSLISIYLFIYLSDHELSGGREKEEGKELSSALDAVNRNRVFQRTVVFKVRLEESNELLDVCSTACLPDGVHAQLRVTEIQGSHTKLGADHRADGGAAGGVVSDDEELQWHLGEVSDLLEKHNAGGVCDVSLVCIDLDDRAVVQVWTVVGLIILRVVWVNAVRHVGRDHEGLGHGGEEVGARELAGQVDLRVGGEPGESLKHVG